MEYKTFPTTTTDKVGAGKHIYLIKASNYSNICIAFAVVGIHTDIQLRASTAHWLLAMSVSGNQSGDRNTFLSALQNFLTCNGENSWP